MRSALFAACLILAGDFASAAEPLHDAIDRHILAGAKGAKPSVPADDGEFLRRATLDFAGRIPTAAEVRAFLADRDIQKRTKLIDRLLTSPEYADRMTQFFHVHLMERLGEHPEWTTYLHASFEKNKPWDEMAREMLRADATDAANRGAAFFFAKRLENYGQNPVDYSALTRDVGRLFLGKDFRCAECHDHLFIDDYQQQHFQGLFAFFKNTFLIDAKSMAVGEKPTTQKIDFMSVFKKEPKQTGPALPGGKEIAIPVTKKGDEYAVKPDPKTKSPGKLKFSTLAALAEQLPSVQNDAFARNMVNRLWFMLMGRGLVHPLDLHHTGNPASHPELLDQLAREFINHKYDMKWLLKELALSQTYQRSSIVPADSTAKPEQFLSAIEKRLSAEQLLMGLMIAVGPSNAKSKPDAALQTKFVKAFANPMREPEDEIAADLRSALFLLNDPAVLALLQPQSGNLLDRVWKLSDGNAIEEIYVCVLSRLPDAEEKKSAQAFLTKHAAKRSDALGKFAWSLLASTEFLVNH
jgi:hypothetical protein